ncbi:hypothetical protein MNV84_04531 [Leishmania braziliensis]|nr:hypothetical protein MNV84_04531 [Leishmania braziliensis]
MGSGALFTHNAGTRCMRKCVHGYWGHQCTPLTHSVPPSLPPSLSPLMREDKEYACVHQHVDWAKCVAAAEVLSTLPITLVLVLLEHLRSIMTATPNSRAHAVAALKLQRDRSTAYQQWTSLFYRAIIGDITATELQRHIQGIVLPEFQRISTQLRSLQEVLTVSVAETVQQPNGHPSPHLTTNAPAGAADHRRWTSSAPLSSTTAKATALARWIDRLQDLEREHYTVTLSLANQLVQHCTPNVCVESERKPLAAAEEDISRRTDEATDIKSLFKPDSSDEEQCELVQSHPTHIAHSTTAPSAAAAPAPSLRVHDVERCSLLRLIPPRYHTCLYFVACHGAVDDLGGSPDHSANDSNDDDGEGGNQPCVEAELIALPDKHVSTDEAPIIAHYAPFVVARRCAAWSSAVTAIVHRQESLRAAIEELCEELQGEISDDA